MVNLLEDPVHEGELREDVLRIQVKLRMKPRGVWVSEFISPLIEVTLHVARGKLRSPLVERKDKLHQNGRSGHLHRLVVQHAEDIALVIRDHEDLDRQLVAFAHLQDEGNEDEGSQEMTLVKRMSPSSAKE